LANTDNEVGIWGRVTWHYLLLCSFFFIFPSGLIFS
jgi:hypothetical protein